MKNCDVAVNGGDGTGPEAVREAVTLLNAAEQKFKLELNYTNNDIAGERYLRTGKMLPESVLAGLGKFPPILVGSIGHPNVKPAILEERILPRTRFELARAPLSTPARAQNDSHQSIEHTL